MTMIFRSVFLLFATLLFLYTANGQDSLLLITGKKLDLKGSAVHYDDRFVYFQTDKQTSKMESDAASVSWGEGNWRRSVCHGDAVSAEVVVPNACLLKVWVHVLLHYIKIAHHRGVNRAAVQIDAFRGPV